MSCYSQGDFSYSSSSMMTFPKPSASWSVSLISHFQNSAEQSRLAAPLGEPEPDGNGSGATAEGICWELTPP